MLKTEEQLLHKYKTEYRSQHTIDLGFFLTAACKHAPTTSFVYKTATVPIGTLFKKVCTLQKIVQEKGVKKLDLVLLFIPNSIAFYGAYYAVLQAGAICVPVNTFLSDSELTHIIKDAGTTFVITLSAEYERVRQVCHAIDTSIVTFALQETLEEIEEVVGNPAQIVPRKEDDIAVILYTSGTTGVPKGVALSSKNVLTNMLQTYTRLFSQNLSIQHTVIAALPLFHSFSQNTCVFSAVYLGARIVLLSKIDRQLLLDTCKQYKPTVFLGVPALYGLLCLLKNAYLDSVQCFVSGGDALSHRIRQAFSLIYGRKICNGYGLSEASPVVAVNLTDEIGEAGCVGTILPGIKYQIRNEAGQILSLGEIGNLYISGDNIMLGYYKDEKQTNQVISDGWLNTGDRAYINHQEHLVIVGREKELIKVKGINVYPQEIENIILMDEAVIRVGVIGKKEVRSDEEYPIAYAQVRSEYKDKLEVIKKRILDLCSTHLAAYKVPKEIFCTTEALATTVTGKVDKKKLGK